MKWILSRRRDKEDIMNKSSKKIWRNKKYDALYITRGRQYQQEKMTLNHQKSLKKNEDKTCRAHEDVQGKKQNIWNDKRCKK